MQSHSDLSSYEFHKLLYILQSQTQFLELATSPCASADMVPKCCSKVVSDSSPILQSALVNEDEEDFVNSNYLFSSTM